MCHSLSIRSQTSDGYASFGYKLIVCLILYLSLSPALLLAQDTRLFDDLSGAELQTKLRSEFYPTSVYDYDRARDSLYATVDRNDGLISCVYTGLTIEYQRSDGDPSTYAFNNDINAEHTWPQSLYNSAEPMVSDLHQLFPSWDVANSTRNNHPFAEIQDQLTETWLYDGKREYSIPDDSIDLYSEYYDSQFEPREDHKGNVARTLFYMWTMYQTDTNITGDETDNQAWFNGMKDMLFDWHLSDPVDDREIERSSRVAVYQGNDNPFVLDTSLVRRAYFTEGSGNGAKDVLIYQDQIIISQVYEGASNDKWIEITNVGLNDFSFADNALFLHLFSNPSGDLSGVEPSNSIRLAGNLEVGESHLFKNSGAERPTHGEGEPTSVANFNGNDPLILSTATGTQAWEFRTDVFGQIDGSVFGSNTNFTRKKHILRANKEWLPEQWEEDDFLEIESVNYSQDTRYLGYHESLKAINYNIQRGWNFVGLPSDGIEQYLFALDSRWVNDNSQLEDNPFSVTMYSFDEADNSFNTVNDLTQRPENAAFILFANVDQANDSPLYILGSSPESDLNSIDYKMESSGSGWNLVGNPLYETLYWSDTTHIYKETAGIFPYIHIWNNEKQAYMSWNGFVEVNGLENGAIMPNQAFFVQARPSAWPGNFQMGSSRLEYELEETPEPDGFVRLRANGSEILFVGDTMDDHYENPEHLSAVLPPSPTGTDQFSFSENGSLYSIYVPESLSGNKITLEGVDSIDEVELVEEDIDLPNGSMVYEIKIENGNVVFDQGYLNTSNESIATPVQFKLHGNYPNPFNPSTTIKYSLGSSSQVQLEVYNLLGQRVAVLVNEMKSAGTYSEDFNAVGLSSGLYLYKLNADGRTETKKMLLLK